MLTCASKDALGDKVEKVIVSSHFSDSPLSSLLSNLGEEEEEEEELV